MPLASQLVQVGHACVEAGNNFAQPDGVCYLVLFGVSSEAHLLDATARLNTCGINFVTFFEPDNALGYTAVCTEPLSGKSRRLLKRFRLWHQQAPSHLVALQNALDSERAPTAKS